ncbi:conjugal transfer protein TraF [Vibrio ostreicida]|uniref:conjugal transfer protein TraF n=1 Tax=Vibrio ostreicida TaxID=526588 RepID=UPI000970325A|nr:conjugal transfer protein TraF [Vibrio ostreicida]
MKKLIKLSIINLSLVGFSVGAAGFVADGRGNGMGNTGVTTADYVLAPFYNPALSAVYTDSDTIGLLLPGLGARVRDTDDTLGTIDALQDSIDQYEANTSSSDAETAVNNALDQLSNDKPLGVDAGITASVAFPLDAFSASVFLHGYADIVAQTNISTSSDTQTRYENSSVDLIAFGFTEFGLTIAKRMSLAGQDIALGVSPKFQTMRTYKQALTVKDFDLSDYDKSETKDNAFNFDLGAVWLYHQFRAGIAIKDLFSQELETLNVGGISTYKLDTQITVSTAYVLDYVSATVDWDLTKQERFSDRDDDTQFLRFGVEGNAMGWAQIRAGYEIDLENTLDNSITAGIGISPGGLVSVDFAGSYADNHQFGLSGNLSFMF